MTSAPPDMVVPMAFCSSAVNDEDSMSGMMCCNMKTRKVRRAKDVDWSVVVVDEEELSSVGDQLWEFVVGILIERQNSFTKSHSQIPTQTNANSHYGANYRNQPRETALFPAGSLKKRVLNLHLSAAASVLGRNPTLAGPFGV